MTPSTDFSKLESNSTITFSVPQISVLPRKSSVIQHSEPMQIYLSKTQSLMNLDVLEEKKKSYPKFLKTMTSKTRHKLVEIGVSHGSDVKAVKRQLIREFPSLSEQDMTDACDWMLQKKETDTGDPITNVTMDKWWPVLDTWKPPTFEGNKNPVKNLRRSVEFFPWFSKHFTERKELTESKLPDIEDWFRETRKLFGWRGKNKVHKITEKLEKHQGVLDDLLDFCKYSRIICDESSDPDDAIINKIHVGSFSVIPSVSLLNTIKSKYTYTPEMWDQARKKSFTGKIIYEMCNRKYQKRSNKNS
eukprot:UN30653